MTDSLGRTLAAATGPDAFLAAERADGQAGRFAPFEELAATVMTTSFTGTAPVELSADGHLSLRLPPSTRTAMNGWFDLARQQAKGAWWLPESTVVKAGPVNLPAYYTGNNPRWAANIAAMVSARSPLAGNSDAFACWALLIPYATDLLAPLALRGPQAGALEPTAAGAAWADAEARYRALGLLTAPVETALARLRPGGGWSRLTTDQQITARQALVHALTPAIDTITARWRATQLAVLLQRYYLKAKTGRPTARAVLTKALQPTLAAFFDGDWLAFLDYLGEQPADDEQIVTALPTARLYVRASAKVEQIAAQQKLPVEQVASMVASYLGSDEIRSPIEQRVTVLRHYWETFDALHAAQPPLFELVGNPWIPPDEDEAFPTPVYERVLPPQLLAETEKLWGSECHPRYPDRLVSALLPQASMAEAFGPALTFWHEIALSTWYICEGPYARSDLHGLADYHARRTNALKATGTPVDLSLFTELADAEQRLGPPQDIQRPIKMDHPDGYTITATTTVGQRRDGFPLLRDIITRHRRAWARQHLETALGSWEGQLQEVSRELNRAANGRGKPLTVKQFARIAAPVANRWFGGDLAALCAAIGEKTPVQQERIHLLPYDRTALCRHVFHALGGRYVTNTGGDVPGFQRSWAMTRLVAQAPRLIQLEELLGRTPTEKEFRAPSYTWPEGLTYPAYTAATQQARLDLPLTRTTEAEQEPATQPTPPPLPPTPANTSTPTPQQPPSPPAPPVQPERRRGLLDRLLGRN
ncbi:stress protein [Streptomyces sp. ICBB 8177]|uniref:stress protein n=1 Tax=Streptomyces sp. ICBB 8177 TaxID=563922 RepID=UPI000D673423|nr:stress protein [Streptomyces sp. ICBB 8177]PWI46212.1 stress protein [Streptomyces sp. ICBB 8177]